MVREKSKRNKSKKKKKRNKLGKIIISFIIILCFVISIIAGIIFGICQAKYDGNIKEMVLDASTLFLEDAEPIYVLVVGISEDIDTLLADTIMLCGYHPQNQEAFIVSIPRDTFVGENKNKVKGSDKINSHYKKGIENIEQKVEEIANLEIDNYIVVKTSMLVKIVDLIGGVEFDVPIDMKYDDPSQNLHINLKKGIQKIDGDKAEQLLRFRHNNDGTTYSSEYGNNDLGRMRTQREFIKTVAKQTLDSKNIFNLKALAEAVFENLETNLEKSKITSYIPYALNINMDNIKMEQLPGEPKRMNGVWVYLHDEEKTEELISELTQNF